MRSLVKLYRQARKAVVAAVGVAAVALSTGLLTGETKAIVAAIVAVATALGVYAAPNEPRPAAKGSWERHLEEASGS